MTDILDRLREKIIADAFESGSITSGILTERLILERRDAAAEIERLTERCEAYKGQVEGGAIVLELQRAALKPLAAVVLWRDSYADAHEDHIISIGNVSVDDVRAAREALNQQPAPSTTCPRCGAQVIGGGTGPVNSAEKAHGNARRTRPQT